MIGGGVQFGRGTTNGAPETMYVIARTRDETVPSTGVPEPGSLALMGIGALGAGFLSRRYGAKKA